jgi:hypothetical protein
MSCATHQHLATDVGFHDVVIVIGNSGQKNLLKMIKRGAFFETPV